MNLRTIVWIIALLPPFSPATARELTVDSSITEVTVYSDRALVSRQAQVELQVGEHSYLFDNLPARIDGDSLQVSGAGGAELRDVRHKTVFLSDSPDPTVQTTKMELEKLQDKQRELADQLDQAEAAKTFVKGMTAHLTSSSVKQRPLQWDTQKWQSMLNFYREKLAILDQEIRTTLAKQRDVKKDIERVSRKLAKLEPGKREKHQVQVVLRASKALPSELVLRYIVHGPSWQPVYDLRVNGNGKSLQLQYGAKIRQNSGEDWRQVALQLSTAKVNVSGTAPELQPWRVAPMPPPVRLRRQGIMKKSMSKPSTTREAAPAPLRPTIQAPPVTVHAQASSVLFAVGGRNTIAGDNNDHKVTIALHNLPAQFRYEAVPKLSPYAYLKAKINNNTEFPLLPGISQIFYDNQFIAKSRLKFVAPGESFWADLGVDESIKVERKRIKKYQKEQGVFSKETQWVYRYEINLKNRKGSPAKLIVHDQFPLSGHKQIKVALLKPNYVKDTDGLKKNAMNFLQWHLELAPGAEKVLTLEYAVSYPQGMVVQGLE